MKRIGVFVCHCGFNIAGTVDVKKVVEEVGKNPDVAFTLDYIYMCSDPGQNLVKETIQKEELDALVIAACSPNLHETTFRTAAAETGLNPYQCEIANIREQCSWVHMDMGVATEKAIRIINSMVEKVVLNESLIPVSVPITRKALVIGAGIAGIQASLDIADSGYEVLLVEKEPSIGGHMAQLSETFPTLDCSQCILTPKMVAVSKHPNITLLTNSELESMSGYIGNITATIRKRTRSIDVDKCTGCGDCIVACPVRYSPQVQPVPDYTRDLSEEDESKLDAILASHAPENPGTPGPETLIQVLQDVNLEYGYLPQFALRYVAGSLDVPLSTVFHVATFYTAFSLEPRGRHLIKVCMGTACHTRGAQRVLEEFERQLEIGYGETTEDSLFSLETVNCLGCCALGPVVMIDGDYHQVSPNKVSSIIKTYSEV